MALLFSPNCKIYSKPHPPRKPNFKFNQSRSSVQFPDRKLQRFGWVFCSSGEDPAQSASDDNEVNNLGVKTALSMLRFYKPGEISPLLPNSCRYVPTCSEYSMIAYKKYGVVKGTILTAWRLCRCNPLGGSGFDPPRWFDETTTPEQ